MKIFVTDKWKIIRYMGMLCLICTTFVMANNINFNVIETISGGRLVPIYNVKTDEAKISLTFDSAWGESR